MLQLRQRQGSMPPCTSRPAALAGHACASSFPRPTAWRATAPRLFSSHFSSTRRVNTTSNAISSQRTAARRITAVVAKAYLHSDRSGGGGSPEPAQPGQLKVLVVGASPAGLAAAVSLAQQAGCAVQVHDSRPDPHSNKHADNSSTLVALGKRGLEALSHLDLSPPPPGGQAPPIAPPTLSSSSNRSPSTSNAGANAGNAGQGLAGLWTPGSANLGMLQGLDSTAHNPEPLPGLVLLQGMVVHGPQGQKREQYSRAASRSKAGGGGGVTGNKTAGIVASDELSLTLQLLSAAAALSHSSNAAQASNTSSPQLVLPNSAAAAAASTPQLKPKGTTPVPQGPTTAPSAEAAQEAALPAVVPAPGTGSVTTAGLGQGGVISPQPTAAEGVAGAQGSVEVHYSSHMVLLDAANRQATFMGPGGQATQVPYDLCIAADTQGGGNLVTSALAELQDRQAAHKHPTAAASAHTMGHSAGVSDVAELEYKGWKGMQHQPQLDALMGLGASKSSSSGPAAGASDSPQKGWLLVWTGPGHKQQVRSSLIAAAGATAAIIPGAPSCTVMAWPSKEGGTWSGCVFTHPQVFEALRSQTDLEQLLGSLSAPAPPGAPFTGDVQLPAAWVSGIAAQLRSSASTARVPAPVLAPPHSLAAPPAGLVCLTTAAAPSASPQLLNPGVSLGLAEAAALSAQIAGQLAGMSTTERAEGLRKAVEQGLTRFDEHQGPEAKALHQLSAQLSWLRHPFSPAAAAAAASVPWGSLAWIGAALGAPRMGLALQWKCLVAVLPIVAAAQRTLLYKLGLGRPENVSKPAVGRSAKLDASYRQPKPAGASTSLDSGIRVDSSSGSKAGQAQTETAAMAAVSGASGAGAAYSLSDLADSVEPCGASLTAFLHTTDMPPTSVWRLLQAAPLIVSVLWGALFWAAAQAIRWGIWAFRAWGWAQVGMA